MNEMNEKNKHQNKTEGNLNRVKNAGLNSNGSPPAADRNSREPARQRTREAVERPATGTLSTQSTTTTTSSASALDKLSSSLERITPHPPELRLRRRRHVHALRRLRVPREPAAMTRRRRPADALCFVLVLRV